MQLQAEKKKNEANKTSGEEVPLGRLPAELPESGGDEHAPQSAETKTLNVDGLTSAKKSQNLKNWKGRMGLRRERPPMGATTITAVAD